MRCQAALTAALTLALVLSTRTAHADRRCSRSPGSHDNAGVAKEKIVLHRVGFDVSGGVRSEAMPMLNEAANLLRGSNGPIMIVVHQRSGSANDALDHALVRRRAKSVRSYLIRHGVTAARLMLDCTALVSDSGAPQLREPSATLVELHVY